MTRWAAATVLVLGGLSLGGLVSAGCAGRQAPPPVRPAEAQFFAPASMHLSPVFTKVTDFNGDGDPNGVEAVVELQDRFGDPTKAAGRLTFQLYRFRPYSPDPRGVPLAGPFEGRLDSAADQKARWSRVNRAYIFQLGYPQADLVSDYLLEAVFESTDGHRLFDRLFIEGDHTPLGPTTGPAPLGGATTAPATAPSTTAPLSGPAAGPGSVPVAGPVTGSITTQEYRSVPATSQPHEPPPAPTSPDVLTLEPVPTLLRRCRAEMAASFVPGRPVRVSRAPGRLDVMGGIADYTGSLVCEATLDRAAAVATQAREDRQVQVFSFNLLDDHRPFTLMLSLDHLATSSIADLRRAFGERGRRWAGYLAGCLAVLHDEKLLDLTDPHVHGINIALYSDVPLGAGVSSSAAIEVATMMNLLDHYLPAVTARGEAIDPMRVAAMCQRVENEVVGAPCGIMDQAASTAGEAGGLMRMVCQPHTLEGPLFLPAGVRAIGINSNVKHSVGGGQYGKTRCAAFMGHKIVLDKMRQMGATAGREMVADPMNGYLANLDLDDYKKFFRPYLPETIKGGQFLLQYGPSIDRATSVEPDAVYAVQSATDHHVFEAHRVREFVRYLEEARHLAQGNPARKLLLDKAGHLMYASHLSYTRDAKLGADECDLLVDLVRARESAGLYGAKITGGGSGGTVAVLCDEGPAADAAVAEILAEYEAKTKLKPDAFLSSSPGAWAAGTAVVTA